jgi:hypothetical protein
MLLSVIVIEQCPRITEVLQLCCLWKASLDAIGGFSQQWMAAQACSTSSVPAFSPRSTPDFRRADRR